MTFRKRLVLTCAATVALGVAAAPMATAKGSGDAKGKKSGFSRTLSTEVLAPFGIAVDGNTVYVADGATNTVSKLVKGTLTPIASGLSAPNSEVAGVDVADDGSIAYTTSTTDESGFVHIASKLVIMKAGQADVVADLMVYEQQTNPDGDVQYGLQPGTDCAAGRAWLDIMTGGFASYTGIQDTHPYAVASLGNGSWAVADAGANAILKVSPTGQVSTIAVLPVQTQTITPGLLASVSVDQEGNPAPVPDDVNCLLGKTYGFEPVPTDVEVGPKGMLSVSTLPGGPEDPSGGARGSVYLVNPATGSSSRLATGFAAATNIGVAGDGTTYVAELFGGKISKVTRNGAVSTFTEVGTPLSVEVRGGFVYAATAGIFGPGGGSVVQYRR